MKKSSLALLSLMILLGCKAPAAAPTGTKTPSKPAASKPLASTAPSGLPAGPTTAIGGLLEMDAGYVVAAGGANVIAAGGANVVAAGGGNVIAAGSANVVAAGGGNVIAAGSANVVAPGGANWIIRGFGVLQAASVPVGTLLPAAGMLVVPVSLVTNRQIGDAVLTGPDGRYTVKVPTAQTGTFRLLAAVPARRVDDPLLNDTRLRYNYMTDLNSKPADNTINEDTTLAFEYLRQIFMRRLGEGLAQGKIDVASTSDSALVRQLAQELNDAMVEARTATLDEPARTELARRCVGMLFEQGMMKHFYTADFKVKVADAISKDKAKFSGKPGDTLASVVLRDVLVEIRTRATDAMRRGVDLNQKAYVKAEIARATVGHPLHGFVIRRPADLNEFVVHAYMGEDNGEGLVRMLELTRDPDLAFEDAELPVIRLKGAAEGIAERLTLQLFTDPTTKRDVVQAIRGGR